jgi:hypothetical protein
MRSLCGLNPTEPPNRRICCHASGRGDEMTARGRICVCACGCGRMVRGERRSRRFHSTACQVKFYRHKARSGATLASTDGEGAGAVSLDGVVTLTTQSREVHCRGCGSPLTSLDGPLPCPAYCLGCSSRGECGCVSQRSNLPVSPLF